MAAFSDISLERGMPASPDAERSILGAILLENAHFHEAAEKKLTCDDFSLDSHRRIFARMDDLIGAGKLKSVEGTPGIRVSHNVDVKVSNYKVTKQ